jgi:hypothetical protein
MMHIDFTVHFWTLLSQFLALTAFLTFLRHVYMKIQDLVQAARSILSQHREVYGWYEEHVKVKPNGRALGGHHI